jgi:hypothetical protein
MGFLRRRHRPCRGAHHQYWAANQQQRNGIAAFVDTKGVELRRVGLMRSRSIRRGRQRTGDQVTGERLEANSSRLALGANPDADDRKAWVKVRGELEIDSIMRTTKNGRHQVTGERLKANSSRPTLGINPGVCVICQQQFHKGLERDDKSHIRPGWSNKAVERSFVFVPSRSCRAWSRLCVGCNSR